MAVKYHCPKCDKRYVEWGAKKLDFQCPDCEEEKLVQVGSGDSAGTKAKAKAKKASLKRRKTKKAVVAKPDITPKKDELDGKDPKGKGNPVESGKELAGEDAPPKRKTKKKAKK